MNAGMLEMMGHFLIDDKEVFELLQSMEPARRKALGDSWLSELAPEPRMIVQFEERLHTCLSDPFISYEKQLEEILGKTPEDAQHEIFALVHSVKEDSGLDGSQRQNLLQTINDAWQKQHGRQLFKHPDIAVASRGDAPGAV